MPASQHFSEYVCGRLKHYVYRLIDPRDGSTFYVGRGQGNRVFDHAAGKLSLSDVSEVDNLKLKAIGQIKNAGLDVQHVVHRHGLTEEAAREVEAALIDAYPGLTNIQPGYEGERGVMHVKEIVAEYEAPVAVPRHKLLLISVNRSIDEHHDLLDAVRFAWKLDANKAKKADYVLAIRRGLIVGAFVAEEWLPATAEHFPTLHLLREGYGSRKGRYGFVGKEASDEIKELFCQKRLPDSERKRGASNPIRYWNM